MMREDFYLIWMYYLKMPEEKIFFSGKTLFPGAKDNVANNHICLVQSEIRVQHMCTCTRP
jgi:hypothetical protein